MESMESSVNCVMAKHQQGEQQSYIFTRRLRKLICPDDYLSTASWEAEQAHEASSWYSASAIQRTTAGSPGYDGLLRNGEWPSKTHNPNVCSRAAL